METAYPSGYGLAAVIRLDEQEIEKLVEHQAAEKRRVRHIGNVNAPRQIVMAGADEALDKFLERALGQARARPADSRSACLRIASCSHRRATNCCRIRKSPFESRPEFILVIAVAVRYIRPMRFARIRDQHALYRSLVRFPYSDARNGHARHTGSAPRGRC